MKFCHVTLAVRNMEASLAFYGDIVGLDVKRRFHAGPETEIAFLGNGETEVELICGNAASHEGMQLGSGVSLGFATESLEDTIALLRDKSYETNGVIESPGPNVSYFFAKDPDGFSIQFVKG